jgi:E3 ubiquitin-protein ligase SIAH1
MAHTWATDFYMASCKIVKSESQIRMDLKEELHNELYDVFVCQNCKEVPKEGAIYTCDSGDHSTCHDCFQTCKVCKCEANIKHRSKALEKVRTTLPLSCKFRKNGCNSVLSMESLIYHEVDCQWRPIFCPELACSSNLINGTKIIFNMLNNHLTEHHTEVAKQLNESFSKATFSGITEDHLNGTTQAEWWQIEKISLNGAQFFCERVVKNQRFYVWVYYYGSKEEAKNYNCTIKVYGGNNEEFIYNGPLQSLDESEDEVIKGECGLMISLGQAKRIVSKEEMKYSIKITCPKEEARDEDVESGISDNENTTSNNST